MKSLVIFLLALFCLTLSLLFMPWAELGFSDQFPGWVASFANMLGLPAIFQHFAPLKTWFHHYLTDAGAKTNFGDYAYVAIMACAMIAAAFAIILIGKEEAEEKTMLPLKK